MIGQETRARAQPAHRAARGRAAEDTSAVRGSGGDRQVERAGGGQGKRRGPTPGRNWLRAAASSASAACRAFSPVRDIRAAISPVTIGVENEVPLHLTMPADVSRTSASTIVLYFMWA